MNKIILYIFLLASIASAKIINIVVVYKTGEKQPTEHAKYVVDPKTKIWQLKNFLFNEYLLKSKDYMLAEQNKKGFKAIGDEVTLEELFEDMADETGTIFILPAKYLKPKEEVEEEKPPKKEEIKEEEKPPKEEGKKEEPPPPPKEEVKKDEPPPPPKEEVKKDEKPFKEEVKKVEEVKKIEEVKKVEPAKEPPKEEKPKEEVKKEEAQKEPTK